MMITHKVSMDLVRTESKPPRIEVVQNDSNTRAVAIALYANGLDWLIPSEVTVTVSYRKSDGKGGRYSAMPDGSSAWTVQDNTVTVKLTRQMMTTMGQVDLMVILSEGERIVSTFALELYVHKAVSASAVEETLKSENYINILSLGSVKTLESEQAVQASLCRDGDGLKLNLGIPKGKDGYTPVKGVDYWTEEERMAIRFDANSIIAEELALRSQLKPEFANTEEECTDISKLYVLPDGYIYAYIPNAVDNNLLPFALDENGNVYNGTGYKENVRWSSSSQAETSATGICLSGWIPVSAGDTVYLKNIILNKNAAENNECLIWWASELGTTTGNNNASFLTEYCAAEWDTEGNLLQFTVREGIASYIRLQGTYMGEDSAVTINQGYTESIDGYSWQNTGHAFVPADYESRIIDLESEETLQWAEILSLKEEVDAVKQGIPKYWQDALRSGAEEINKALTNAGRNKSAFLFYSDAHWNYGSQMSPTLLKYLYQHTGMTKTFFGGDIVNNEGTDYNTMAYLWQWRKQLKDLPNHHSVVGNHDDGNATNNLFPEKYVYSYLLAPEETPDIVSGDSGMYYYIDSPAEKTRYLFLDTAYKGVTDDQQAFAKEALISASEGWHIVAVAHIWHDTVYNDDGSTQVGDINANASILLAMFDSCNSRSGDYAACGGRVEFCIGGHTHVDHDSTSATGIPIILVETDSRHVRSGLGFAAGTATEASVNGIIADYDAHRIRVIRIGRGNSRTVWFS